MKEHPIIFSTPMVQAILEGRKTQTRRIVKPQPDDDGLWNHSEFPMSLQDEIQGWYGTVDETGKSKGFNCPYGWPDHTLWVRETWRPIEQDFGNPRYEYKATEKINLNDSWKPSIHMPRSAGRIFLRVKKIIVQRLHDINPDDIIAEGVRYPTAKSEKRGFVHPVFKIGEQNTAIDFMPDKWQQMPPKQLENALLFAHWAELWCSINDRASWDANPWVWAIHFQKIKD